MGRWASGAIVSAALTIALAASAPTLASDVLPSVMTYIGASQPAAAAEALSGNVCSADLPAVLATAPGRSFDDGAVQGTTSRDLGEFAARFNEIRVEHCLDPIPAENFRYDACLEDRLAWIAGDPSEDPASAWGHDGSVRSDGLPSVGCDGNLAGGTGNSGATVAAKWWDSLSHRASLYRPDSDADLTHVCIAFAMTHGGVPDESPDLTRASARWLDC